MVWGLVSHDCMWLDDRGLGFQIHALWRRASRLIDIIEWLVVQQQHPIKLSKRVKVFLSACDCSWHQNRNELHKQTLTQKVRKINKSLFWWITAREGRTILSGYEIKVGTPNLSPCKKLRPASTRNISKVIQHFVWLGSTDPLVAGLQTNFFY